jgi:hypothetical protein
MAARYAVFLSFNGVVPVDRISKVLNSLKDWLRINPDAWLVYTDLRAPEIRDRLKTEFAKENPNIVVVEAEGSHWAVYAGDAVRKWMRNAPNEDGE